MCSFIPKTPGILLINLLDNCPGGPRFVSWRWRAQNLDDLLFPLVPVVYVRFDVARAILNNRSVARVELGVLGLPFCKCLVVVVHLLEAGHVRPKVLENRRPVTEDGVCREEGFVRREVDSDRIGGVTGCEENVDGSEIGVRGVVLADGHWQLKIVCEVVPGGTRRRLGIIFYWNGLDVVVQG